MAETTASVGLKVDVPSVRSIISLTPHPVWIELDEHGLVLDLPRLKGEKNEAYRKRLFEVVSRRADSTYQGLINAITRELGYTLFKAIRIIPKKTVGGEYTAPDPYIEFNGVYLYLYSDYYNGTLDVQIDRYTSGGYYEHVYRLVEMINTSTYFEAEQFTGVDDYTRSMTILNQSDRRLVDLEIIPESNKFRLQKYPVCKYTVYFSDRSIFNTEVASEGAVTTKGTYFINYQKGIVTSYLIPSPGTTVRYSYSTDTLEAWASPVILHDIGNSNFNVMMFEQMLQDDGTYVNGLPTSLGQDIINELVSYIPMYWGE